MQCDAGSHRQGGVARGHTAEAAKWKETSRDIAGQGQGGTHTQGAHELWPHTGRTDEPSGADVHQGEERKEEAAGSVGLHGARARQPHHRPHDGIGGNLMVWTRCGLHPRTTAAPGCLSTQPVHGERAAACSVKAPKWSTAAEDHTSNRSTRWFRPGSRRAPHVQ
jgi:hypothetical protein